MCNEEDREFVGMDMCIYCGECKQLLLQTHFLPDGTPFKGIKRQQSTSPEPCDKCKESFKEKGIVPMIEASKDEHTGEPIYGHRYVFINYNALSEEFQKLADTHGFVICDMETIDALLERSDNENR